MVDTEILSNNMKFPSHECEMAFCNDHMQWQPTTDHTIPSRDLITDLDFLPNLERLQ